LLGRRGTLSTFPSSHEEGWRAAPGWSSSWFRNHPSAPRSRRLCPSLARGERSPLSLLVEEGWREAPGWSAPEAPRRSTLLLQRLGDEHRNLAAGLRLILVVRRKRFHRELPQARALVRVADLARLHLEDLGAITQLDVRIRAQVVHPVRVLRRAALRADQDVAVSVLDPHERCLADRAGLVADVGDDDHRQAGVAQRGALGAAAFLVELDLLAHPIPGARNVLGHRTLLASTSLTIAP